MQIKSKVIAVASAVRNGASAFRRNVTVNGAIDELVGQLVDGLLTPDEFRSEVRKLRWIGPLPLKAKRFLFN